MTPLDFAAACLRVGWCPVPVPFREKAPRLFEWPKFRPKAADLPALFGGACNVGVNLGDASGGLADVDLDSPEALVLAPELLPPTLTFGRASKARSHWLFDSLGASTAQFKDPVDHAMLVELRATPEAARGKGLGGSMTVFPPSTHPSGEAVRFDSGWKGLPVTMDAVDLRQRVASLAVAAVIWKRSGEAQARAFLDGDPAAFDGLDALTLGRAREWLGLRPPVPFTPRIGGGFGGGGGVSGGGWIDQVRQRHPALVASALGLEADLKRGIRTCPACGATTRSSSDRRPALGFTTAPDGTVLWVHGKCGARGNSVQLAALVVLHVAKPTERGDWAQLRERLEQAGIL